MIPWMVAGLEPAQTFVELFQQLCAGSVVCLRDYAGRLQDSRLVRAFVGTAKDSLVAVDVNLPVSDVCRQFGSYVRLNCEKQGEGESSSCVARKNAFEIMMMSQKSLARKSELPSRIDRPRNNKDKMFNKRRYKEKRHREQAEAEGILPALLSIKALLFLDQEVWRRNL